MLDDFHKRELVKDAKKLTGANPLDRCRDNALYARWLGLVGMIGSCDVDVKKGYLVRQTDVGDGFKVDVEIEANAETAS